MNEQTKKLVINGVVILVVLSIGTGIGFAIAKREASVSGNTFRAGWDAAKKRLAESEYAIAAPSEALGVSGEIIDVRSDGVTVKIRPIEPLADPTLDIRVIKFDGDTKFSRLMQRDQVVYQKEVQEYARKMQQATGKMMTASTTVDTPPQLFIQKEISRSDIKKGEQVTVSAAQNIKDIKEFVAVSVLVHDTASNSVNQ